MAATKNLCAQLPIDLHQKISEGREAAGLTPIQYIFKMNRRVVSHPAVLVL